MARLGSFVSVPGGDGNFTKGLSEALLGLSRNYQAQAKEAKRNALAEEQAKFVREDRAEAEASKEFLRNYRFDPFRESTALDPSANKAFQADVKSQAENIMREEGIIDASGKVVEGAKYSPKALSRLQGLNEKVIDSRRNILTTQEDVRARVYDDVLTRTGNPTLAKNVAESKASSFASREAILKADKESVDNFNKKLERQEDRLFKILDLEQKSKGNKSSKTFADAYKELEDLDVGYIDSGEGQRFLKEAKASGIPASHALEFLKNNLTVGGLSNDKDFSLGDIDSAIVNLKDFSSKKGGTSTSIQKRLEALGSPMHYRSLPEIMASSGDLALDGLIGRSFPSSVPTNNTNTTYKSISPINTTNTTNTNTTITPKPLPKTADSTDSTSTSSIDNNKRLLDGLIDFGRSMRVANNRNNPFEPVSEETVSRRNERRQDILNNIKEFFSNTERDEALQHNNIVMRIAKGEPVSSEDMRRVYSSASPEIKRIIDSRLSQL